MPITSSAKKALRSSRRKRQFGLARKKALKGAVKSIKEMVTLKNKDEALKLLPNAYKAIDKAAKTGYLKKNTASRYKSRITKLVNKI